MNETDMYSRRVGYWKRFVGQDTNFVQEAFFDESGRLQGGVKILYNDILGKICHFKNNTRFGQQYLNTKILREKFIELVSNGEYKIYDDKIKLWCVEDKVIFQYRVFDFTKYETPCLHFCTENLYYFFDKFSPITFSSDFELTGEDGSEEIQIFLKNEVEKHFNLKFEGNISVITVSEDWFKEYLPEETFS